MQVGANEAVSQLGRCQAMFTASLQVLSNHAKKFSLRRLVQSARAEITGPRNRSQDFLLAEGLLGCQSLCQLLLPLWLSSNGGTSAALLRWKSLLFSALSSYLCNCHHLQALSEEGGANRYHAGSSRKATQNVHEFVWYFIKLYLRLKKKNTAKVTSYV